MQSQVIKVVNKKAFDKNSWYPILEKFLKIFVSIWTKEAQLDGDSILGGVISGGLTCDHETGREKDANRNCPSYQLQ